MPTAAIAANDAERANKRYRREPLASGAPAAAVTAMLKPSVLPSADDLTPDVQELPDGPRGVGPQAVIEPLAERDQPRPHEQEEREHHQSLGQCQGDEEERPLGEESATAEERQEPQQGDLLRAIGRPHILRASRARKRPLGRAMRTAAITR